MPAETQPATLPATHTPKYKRLTQQQQLAALALSKAGKTQVEISLALGCHQTSIGRWLNACQDSTAEATAYLRGQALRAAHNVVQNGKPADHIQVLKGIGVLAEAQTQGVVINIGGSHADVKVLTVQPVASDNGAT